MKKTTVSLILLAAALVPIHGQSIQGIAQGYNSALIKFERGRGNSSLEAVLRKGTALSDRTEALEDLDEAGYTRFTKTMRGFLVNREEIVFIEPDLDFFYKLAMKRGSAADRSFFHLMKEVKPDSVWPAYIEQLTDMTGCTIFGDGTLTTLYGKVSAFRRTYPLAYSSFVETEIQAIRAEFRPDVCACGDQESVIREFGNFIRTFPRDKKISEIKSALRTIKRDKGFRSNCHPT